MEIKITPTGLEKTLIGKRVADAFIETTADEVAIIFDDETALIVKIVHDDTYHSLEVSLEAEDDSVDEI